MAELATGLPSVRERAVPATIERPRRSVTDMTYSQPDPAEETTQADEPQQPDTDHTVEEQGEENAALEIDSSDVPTSSDDSSN
ncbi:hypothetical protein DEJ16_09155 [Curtobacterium sp. MCJR17_055]|nr:hypothetical protein DEI87_07150 [Curtobacterium sp. MCBD17_029]PYY42403.1 hypothetical protein DEJ32_02850 [Curtobacterium sp. MCPF17_046]PYY55659.1 hypothetical protein DEJ16_09155 [Curtobacterium sp. MCJR17_055]PYY60404.1 hypothetical protein DEJ26_06275 [Curtobacterium sp. MCPF17_015]PZE90933.1 hypothetical protein DEI95_11335 [Curtobacterium sp. MCBD17_008]